MVLKNGSRGSSTFDVNFTMALISLIIGIIGLILGLYLGIFYEKKPRLKIEIFSNAPVFSIKEEVQELKVLFKGENVRQSRKSLSLFTLKFSNFGNQTIKRADFSPKQPFSIFIKNGELIETKLIEFSDEKFARQFEKEGEGFTTNEKGIFFEPFFMEAGEFMIIKMLIMHNDNMTPSIYPDGMIADVNKIIVDNSLMSKVKRENVIKESLQGGLGVQSFRFLLYYFPIIIVFLSLKIRKIIR